MDVSCPQCGNPQLDVDAENSVVYCKNCGFAVQVDPQTGEARPLNPGGQPGPAQAAAYGGTGERLIMGTEPLTFFLGGTVIALLMVLMFNLDILIAGIFWALVAYIYFTHH